MRIGFFITTMNCGGAERVMSLLANYFSSDNTVYLFIYYEVPSFYELHPSIKIIHLKPGIPGIGKVGLLLQFIFNYFKIKKILKHNKIECIVSFLTVINCFSIILGKRLGIPVIISERNEPLLFQPKKFISILRRKLYRKANAIVLQTNRSEISFESVNVKLPPLRKVIFNPIDPIFMNHNLERENIILSVGRLSFEKGHDLLLNAFKLSNNKNWELHFVGDGIEKDNLIELSRKLNIADQVVWLGKQISVSDLLNKSAIFILPSRTEGFPNALCEAMICGCAVISFDCQNGPSELIENMNNGLLVPNGNISEMSIAINMLIEDSQLRLKLSAEASKLQSQLSINSICLQWEELISCVLYQSNINRSCVE
jgi:GalNAc-alpha-(1->4)-GalNAc-alpha-(1->3)-diNAcBac-PP-undecaprenol alpha-1,4-N-acetyl-D-galactosaminyltransferase